MAKNSNYFPHEAQARNDNRLLRLRMRHGAEGYGIYFMLLERLRDSDDYVERSGYDVVAFDLRVGEETVRSVVEDFGLFETHEDGGFTSPGFRRRMSKVDELSQKRAEAVRKRTDRKANKEDNPTNALQNPTNALQNSTNALQNSTSDLQSRGFVGVNKNIKTISDDIVKIKNKISSSDDDDDGAHATSTPPPDKKIIFDLACAVKGWKTDAEWLGAAADRCEILPDEVLSMTAEFGKKCRAEGKQHIDDADARSHFIRWVGTDSGKKSLAKVRARKRREQAAKQAAARASEKPPEAAPPEQKPVKPAEMIRRWGYDPEKVTMAQVCSPEWRAKNPPDRKTVSTKTE